MGNNESARNTSTGRQAKNTKNETTKVQIIRAAWSFVPAGSGLTRKHVEQGLKSLGITPTPGMADRVMDPFLDWR